MLMPGGISFVEQGEHFYNITWYVCTICKFSCKYFIDKTLKKKLKKQQQQKQQQQQHQQNDVSNDMKILFIELLQFFLHCKNIFLKLALMPLTNI